MQVPELTDDAVVELAREGGVAFIPKLSGQRTIALSSLNEAQRQTCQQRRNDLRLIAHFSDGKQTKVPHLRHLLTK